MVSHKSNHKQKKPFRPHSGANWNRARPKRADRPPPPSPPSGYKKPRLNGDNPFCLLPPEIHHKVLLFLPPRDVNSSRRTCQSFCERVGSRELSLAMPQNGDSIAELRAQIEEIKSRALPPSDADSFFEALSFWVSRRGYYESMRESRRSLEKWFGFVFGGEESATRRWARLSAETLRLYQRLCENGGELPASEEQRFVYDSGPSAPDISTSMLQQLCQRLESTGKDAFTGRFWDVRYLEYYAYPNEQKQQWKLTNLEEFSRLEVNWEGRVRKPRGTSDELIGPLGLPDLPSTIFCYYVQDEWAWRLINKHRAGTGLAMDPLMKATVLKQIRLF